jgi:hypothetical protein
MRSLSSQVNPGVLQKARLVTQSGCGQALQKLNAQCNADRSFNIRSHANTDALKLVIGNLSQCSISIKSTHP